MVWGFGGFGRLIGGDHDSDDDRHKAPQKLSNADRHAAVMAEAAALGLMDTKPEPAKRPEKPPEKAKPKAPERAVPSEPSGDSSRHAGSPASTEEADHKVKKKKKKGKHRHSELPGELSAEGTSEASPQVQAGFDTSWQANAGFGNLGGAGFGNDFGTGFGFGAGGLDPTPEMGPSDLGWGQSPTQVLEAPPAQATSRRSPRQQMQSAQVLEAPPAQATSRRSPRQQMQSAQDWASGTAQEWQMKPASAPSPTARSAVDISWALPTHQPCGSFGGSRSPRKVDISWAMRPQPARALRRMASPREEAPHIQKDEREVMAFQRALAEEAAAAAAAKTLAQAEEVSRRRDEIVERLAQEIRDLKEKLATVSAASGARQDLKTFGAHAVTPTSTSSAWAAQSWEPLPKEGGAGGAGGRMSTGGDAWGAEKSQMTMTRQESKDLQEDGGGKHRKDKERHSRRRHAPAPGASEWPEAEAHMGTAWSKPRSRTVSGELPDADQPKEMHTSMTTPALPVSSWDSHATPMQRQRSGSGEMKSTPMMRRASGEMRSTPTLQRNGSAAAQLNGFGDMRSTPMQRQRSGSGEMKSQAQVTNDEAWAIEEDRMEKYRSVFARADVDGDGFVEPTEARAVLVKSNLPQDELAQIYTLADVDKDGRLNEGEFLCALHLAYKRSKEGLLPTELPGPLLALAQRPEENWSVKPEELGHYLQTFQRLDAQSKGIVGQEEGREIFESSGLPVQELSFIWQLSDRDADGSLVFQEFAMTMAIVARRRRGWSLPTALPVALVRSVESFSPVSWSVSAGELESYRTIFQRVDRNGVADLVATKDLLEQSQLPVSELSAIYAMSDLDHDGRLSEPEFLCAMALVARRRKGAPLPEQLPLELREACWSMPSTNAEAAMNQPNESLPLWQPNHEELRRFQQLFDQLQDHGFVSADRAREVLESSGLPLNDLAKIWDLADAGDDGKLSLGEFLCAMSLSARRREGRQLPQSLPDELLPCARLRVQDKVEMQRYLAMFQEQVPRGSAMPAAKAAEILQMSELPPSDLARIWNLSGGTDNLDLLQFLHAMALTARRREGQALPAALPADLLLAAQLVEPG